MYIQQGCTCSENGSRHFNDGAQAIINGIPYERSNRFACRFQVRLRPCDEFSSSENASVAVASFSVEIIEDAGTDQQETFFYAMDAGVYRVGHETVLFETVMKSVQKYLVRIIFSFSIACDFRLVRSRIDLIIDSLFWIR